MQIFNISPTAISSEFKKKKYTEKSAPVENNVKLLKALVDFVSELQFFGLRHCESLMDLVDVETVVSYLNYPIILNNKEKERTRINYSYCPIEMQQKTTKTHIQLLFLHEISNTARLVLQKGNFATKDQVYELNATCSWKTPLCRGGTASTVFASPRRRTALKTSWLLPATLYEWLKPSHCVTQQCLLYQVETAVIVAVCNHARTSEIVLCDPSRENESAPRAENVRNLLFRLVGGTPDDFVDKGCGKNESADFYTSDNGLVDTDPGRVSSMTAINSKMGSLLLSTYYHRKNNGPSAAKHYASFRDSSPTNRTNSTWEGSFLEYYEFINTSI
ncbi:hypothetical protein WN51_11199 [Melipona quadrifasciata]|uniref:Uncharacterized protein n=1 Tax=Melipona quadrifasciata TaxID=166423 RepID=A0A0M9A410_9HYME|nr:hypothetical protein WN51_11199 [Melipona quadrifasciata]